MHLYERFSHPYKARNTNEVHASELASQSFNEKLAVTFTKRFGSIWAFYILVAWMFIWMALASGGIWLFRYDPYPYQFLLFCSNLIQLWALPVIMVGQNVLSRKQELIAEDRFHSTTKIFSDIEHLMNHLAAQDQELIKQTIMTESVIESLKEYKKHGR